MSDLISRSALLKEFKTENEKSNSDLWHITGIKVFIENQPTAYDVDKVMEQLEEKLAEVENEKANLKGVDQQILLAQGEYLIGKQIAYATAIDIIRAGGKE